MIIKMVKVKLPCFLLVVLVILSIVQSSSQATIPGKSNQQSRPSTSKEFRERVGSTKADGSIVFPDDNITIPSKHPPEEKIFMPIVGQAPPSCANGTTFCESVDEYPKDHVASLLKKQGHSLKGFFTKDVIYTVVQDRIDPTDESPLCAAREEVIYPKVAQNKDNKWMFVVNEKNYTQGVRIERCINEGECNFFFSNVPSGYESHCKQNYIYRTLLALTEGGESYTDTFKLPSCCTCVVKMVGNRIGDRMALPLTLAKTTPTSVTKHRLRN